MTDHPADSYLPFCFLLSNDFKSNLADKKGLADSHLTHVKIIDLAAPCTF